MWYHFTPVRMAVIKKIRNSSVPCSGLEFPLQLSIWARGSQPPSPLHTHTWQSPCWQCWCTVTLRWGQEVKYPWELGFAWWVMWNRLLTDKPEMRCLRHPGHLDVNHPITHLPDSVEILWDLASGKSIDPKACFHGSLCCSWNLVHHRPSPLWPSIRTCTYTKKRGKKKKIQPNTICLRLPKIQAHSIYQIQSKYIHPLLITSGVVGGIFMRFISCFIELTLWKIIPMVVII